MRGPLGWDMCAIEFYSANLVNPWWIWYMAFVACNESSQGSWSSWLAATPGGQAAFCYPWSILKDSRWNYRSPEAGISKIYHVDLIGKHGWTIKRYSMKKTIEKKKNIKLNFWKWWQALWNPPFEIWFVSASFLFFCSCI